MVLFYISNGVKVRTINTQNPTKDSICSSKYISSADFWTVIFKSSSGLTNRYDCMYIRRKNIKCLGAIYCAQIPGVESRDLVGNGGARGEAPCRGRGGVPRRSFFLYTSKLRGQQSWNISIPLPSLLCVCLPLPTACLWAWYAAGCRCPLHVHRSCSPEHRRINTRDVPGAQATNLRPFFFSGITIHYREERLNHV